MASNIFSNNHTRQTSIALWGPSGAGKDWLIRSFRKELDYYNSDSVDFHFELLHRLPGEDAPAILEATLPPNKGDTGNVDFSYTFTRVALINDLAHKISQHEHEMIIHNDAGANLAACLEDPVSFASTYTSLIQSQNILLVLGIPREEIIERAHNPLTSSLSETSDFPQEMEEYHKSSPSIPVATRADWSRAEYYRFIELLLKKLSEGPRRNLAVCMTKSDLLNLRGDDPLAILEIRHGLDLRGLLKRYSEKHNIKVFTTSAAGYFLNEGKASPNFINGVISDVGHWKPINAAAPFFWIFEKIERDRLQKGNIFSRHENLNIYYPYPPPKGF